MGQQYPYYRRKVKKNVVALPIYGARDIFLLFFYHKDTEYGSRGMEIGVVGPIFTHENIKGPTEQLYPNSTIWEQKNVVFTRIYGVRDIILLFCNQQDTESD